MARSQHRGGRRRRSGRIGQPAPTARDLVREERSEASRIARRRIALSLVVATVVAGGAIAVTSWLNQPAETDPPDAAVPDDDGASLLLGLTNEDAELVSIVLISSHSVDSPRLVLFPPSLATVLPGFGERDLAEAVAFGGSDLLELTMANLLGIRIDAVGVAEADEFVAAVGYPIEVDLTAPLLVEDPEGERVEFGEGSAERDAEELTRLLSEQGTGDQRAWLVRQSAVWQAVLAEAADDAEVLDRILLAAAQGSDVAYQALSTAVLANSLVVTAGPVERAEVVGGGGERYTLSAEDGAEFVAATVPYLQLVEEPRLRVEILNGNGLIGTTGPVARVLIGAGYRVVFTDNADRQDYEVSRFIAQGLEHQEAAVAAQRLLGTGEVFLEQRQPSGVVDLTIIVGSDLAVQG